MQLSGERVLVVGGTTGIGFATAQSLAEAGATPIVAGRSRDKVDAAVAALPDGAAGVTFDMTDRAGADAAMAELASLDHVVLAGSGSVAWGQFAEITADQLAAALRHKLIGYWTTLQAALAVLRRDGSVVMLGGAASRTAMPGTAALAAVNGGITQMAQTLARELAPLRVNVVSPGLVRTPAYDGMPADMRENFFANAAAGLPVGRTGEPEDIAAAVRMLVANGYATGALLDVDGGARV